MVFMACQERSGCIEIKKVLQLLAGPLKRVKAVFAFKKEKD